MIRKAKIWLVTALLCIVSAFSFTACDFIAELFGVSPVGKYYFDSMSSNGQTYEVGDNMGNGIVLTKDFMVIELKDDNVMIFTTMGMQIEGTWEQNGDELTLTIQNDPQVASWKKDTLTMEDDGATIVLKK